MILAINWHNALVVTLFGFLLVFLVLCLLIFIISLFGKIMTRKVRTPKTAVATDGSKSVHEDVSDDELHLSADQSAAIAMALHLYYTDVHDEESHVMTIKNVERRYSPWNSKIYGINNLVR